MSDLHPLLAALAALVPSAGVAFLFWLALRSIITADRRERTALARLDSERQASANDEDPPRKSD